MKKSLLWIFAAICIGMIGCSEDDNNAIDPTPDEEVKEGPELEDLKTIVEIASFDTTFNDGNKYPDQTWMSATVNWIPGNWLDEFIGIRISVAEQKDLIEKAKKGNGGKDVAIYISSVHAWPAATGQYSAIIYKGKTDKFEEVARGNQIDYMVNGNNWPRLFIPLDRGYRITADEDLFVGYYAMNTAQDTYPGTIMQKNNAFKGKTAKYPSFGLCPDSGEMIMQDVNDITDERWSWVEDGNWCVKVIIAKEIMYN